LGKNILRSEVFYFVIEIKSVFLQRFKIEFYVREDFQEKSLPKDAGLEKGIGRENGVVG
jgi:hypothetical protein